MSAPIPAKLARKGGKKSGAKKPLGKGAWIKT